MPGPQTPPDPLRVVAPLDDTRTVELRVAEALRELIVTRELPPGTSLPLRDLAQRFGVSVMPVRLAIRDLVNDGLVDSAARSGTRVTAMSLEEFEALWSSRTGIEPWLARRGAERLTDDDFAELETRFARVRKAAEAGRRERYLETVWAYRLRCYEAAERPAIVRSLLGLYERGRRYNHLTVAADERLDRALAHMERFHDACRARDGRAAQQVMREALDWTMDFVVDELGDDRPPI